MDDLLREELTGALAGSGVPGCVLAVTGVNEALDMLTYGSASFSPPRPVSERTVFHLFSGTKLYTATALMLLVDRGIVGLISRLWV